MRSATVPANMPTVESNAGCARPDVGVPIAKSSAPVILWSRIASTACSAMNVVALCWRAIAVSATWRAAGMSNAIVAAGGSVPMTRRLSVGRSTCVGSDRSVFSQNASWS